MRALHQKVGIRIRQLREERGLSQEALAALCSLHRTYIGLIERGERNLSLITVEVIAQQLGVPVYDIFRGIETPASTKPRSQTTPSTIGDLNAQVAAILQVLIKNNLIDASGFEALLNSCREASMPVDSIKIEKERRHP